MLGGILAGLLTKPIIDSFMGTALDAFKAYNNKQISKAELDAQVQRAYLDTFAKVEEAYADSYAKAYGSFMGAAAQNAILTYGWALVVATQLAVLLWHQVGIPAMVYFTETTWPSSGDTINYAYFLLAALFGAGALMMRPRVAELNVTKR